MSPAGKKFPELEEILLCGLPKRVEWCRHKVFVIDNWRALHAREEVPPEEVRFRRIERTFLKLTDL